MPAILEVSTGHRRSFPQVIDVPSRTCQDDLGATPEAKHTPYPENAKGPEWIVVVPPSLLFGSGGQRSERRWTTVSCCIPYAPDASR
jgi:hypothetical protein